MTGGSVGNQHAGLENNARRIAIKGLLFSASKRLSTSTLQMSMVGAEGRGRDTHDPPTSHCETAFVEHVTARSCRLSNSMEHSGRLRTSSLTMDVSTNNPKDMDSGNSSLIDSSSADSYQDFGSWCRSPASSSKSDQSLTSVNHNEFQIDSNRQRHSSISDSIGGSSGKMSINTSDITESSEDSLAQDKHKDDVTGDLPVYVQEDAYSDSECQPFLYLSGNDSLHASNEDIKNGNSFCRVSSLERCKDENLNYSSGDILNSTVINIDLNQTSHELLRKKVNRRVKDKDVSTHMKYTAGERKPLLHDRECRFGATTADTISFTSRFKSALRRSASVGNISEVLLDNFDPVLDPTVSTSPQPFVNSHTKAAYQMAARQPEPDCTSESQSLTLFDHHREPYRPNRLDSSQVPGLSSAHAPVNFPYSHSPENQLQHNQAGFHSHLCSNYDHPCMPLLMFNNEYESPHASEITSKTPACISHTAPLDNMQGNGFPDTSQAATMGPVQNLESVLGHGTPVSVSVLKQGLKPLKSENNKPLEVLVPKMKVPVQEVNQLDFIFNLTSNPMTHEVKNSLNNDYLKVDKNRPMESPRELKTQLSPANEINKSFTSNNENSPCENKLYTESHFQNESHMYPPVGMCNKKNVIFYDRIPKEYFQYYLHNQTLIPSMCVPLCSGDDSEFRMENNLHRSAPENCHNPQSFSFNVNQQTISDSNNCHNAESARLPTMLDGTCLSEPIFNRNSQEGGGILPEKSNKDNEPKTNSLPTPDYRHQLVNNSKPQGQHEYNLTRYHFINTHYPAAKHNTEQKGSFFGNEMFSNQCVQNAQNQLFQQYQGHPDKPDPTNILRDDCNIIRHDSNILRDDCNILRDESGLSQNQVDDNGYQAGMMLTVPKACFVAGFLESHDHLNESRTNSVRNSVPSSIDSGNPVNRGGSLLCSTTSQLGLLKANLDSKRQCDHFVRDIPDYKYLCFVASVLNPLLGLVALACNHYAQKDLKQHRRRRANNFYFATIAFSTVAIFLTLIGGALLIAHSVILRGDKRQPLTPPMDDDCKDKLFGMDDSLQTFFGLEFDLYCEITKNEKIMQALKRFWLEDNHNKEIHSKQREKTSLPTGIEGRNATTAGKGEMQIGGPDVFGEATTLNDTSSREAKGAPEEHLHSDNDPTKSNMSMPMKQLSANGTSNNSLTRSNENPIIPPGLQGEYGRFPGGERRTTVNDRHSPELRNALKSEDQFSSQSNDRPSWTTTVSTVREFPINATDDSVDEVVKTGDIFDTANSSLTN